MQLHPRSSQYTQHYSHWESMRFTTSPGYKTAVPCGMAGHIKASRACCPLLPDTAHPCYSCLQSCVMSQMMLYSATCSANALRPMLLAPLYQHTPLCRQHLSSLCMHRGKVKAYYAAEGAFYTASVFMLLLWEERRKDFWVMMLHHLVTFALITASYSLS